MERLPVVMFAVAMAIWGLASISDGGDNDKSRAAYRPVELARTSDGTLLTPTQKVAALRAARFESRGEAAIMSLY
jgi:hypothetical protein